MDGKIVIMDYSSYERQKIRHIIEKVCGFEIIEISGYNDFKLVYSTLKEVKLVIIDINFPSEKEGLEILSLLNSSASKEIIPVIIVTKTDSAEVKSAALGLRAKDYIVRPFPVSRLESSIRSLINLEKLFFYDTSGINDITMSFDELIMRELNYAKRLKSQLSLIIITVLKLDTSSEEKMHEEIKNKDKVFPVAAALAHASLRATDTISINKGRDIIIVLPCTSDSGAEIVCKKLKIRLLEELHKLNIDQSEYIYPVHVTYPEDGDDFQALMRSAFEKVSAKEMLEKIVSISTDTKKYANKQYKQFQRWY